VTVVLRPFVAQDAPRLAQIATESSCADGRPVAVTAEEILEELSLPNCDPTSDVVVASTNGEIHGYGYTYMLHNPGGDERCYVFGHVDPRMRRRGIGSLIMDATIRRAHDILRSSHGAGDRFVRADCLESNADARALFERAGLIPVRWFSELARAIDPPLDSTLPDGVSIEPWSTHDGEVLRTLKNDAFADHWGSTPTSPDNWKQLTSGFGARLDLSFVAVASETPVGLLLTHRYPLDDELIGARQGWIDKLATSREWRGKGVARSLIAHAINAYRTENLTHAALGVDANSQTGANRLYEGLGFTLLRSTVTYSATLR
jgi:mycothiol synthase